MYLIMDADKAQKDRRDAIKMKNSLSIQRDPTLGHSDPIRAS